MAEGEPGFYLQFDVPTDHVRALDSLENKVKAIELVAVQSSETDPAMLSATVFVPDQAKDFFGEKIEAYRTKETPKGKPKNEALVARLEDVRLASVRALFTDSAKLFPRPGHRCWWEVWIRVGRRESFLRVAERLSIATKEHFVEFPERDVLLVLADVESMESAVRHSDAVAELRLSKDSPSVFLEMRGA
ncbi:hypothetical protein EON82_25640, partial [bacterium]